MDFTDLMKTWPDYLQVGFSAFTVLTGAMLCRSVIKWMVILFRGYPSSSTADVSTLPLTHSCRMECENEENLTGLCLSKLGCKTEHECGLTIERYNDAQD